MSVIEKLRLGLQGQFFQGCGDHWRELEVLPENPGLFCLNPFHRPWLPPLPRLEKPKNHLQPSPREWMKLLIPGLQAQLF